MKTRAALRTFNGWRRQPLAWTFTELPLLFALGGLTAEAVGAGGAAYTLYSLAALMAAIAIIVVIATVWFVVVTAPIWLTIGLDRLREIDREHRRRDRDAGYRRGP